MALAILGVVVTPLNDMGKCFFGALKRQINYVTSYHANIGNLKDQVNLLNQKRTDVRRHVETAENRLDVLSEEVKEWLKKTERAIEDDMRTFEVAVNTNKSCLKGLCPDLISRLKLSKKAVSMSKAVNCLLQQQGNFTRESIAHPRPPASVELVRTGSIVENLSSRDKIMENVMEALGNDRIRSIAVHGMGGIGKTTLVDKINNKLHGSQLFKKVIKVVVSKEPSLNIIQDTIAGRLGLNLKGEPSTSVRANRLIERLKAEESVLIILDDLWETLDVVAIGIPGGSEHVGCKIMLTTRNFDICNQMKIQEKFKLDPLSEDESWVLFETKAGDVVRCSNLKLIAQEIVRKCRGSPLAIATLGLTLRGKEEFVWKEALRVLNNPSQSGLQETMPEVVKCVRFSYEHLQTWEIKLCFLFCCLYPEDYNIDLLELRDYGVGEGFLDVNTLEEGSIQLLSFVKKLKDCGLLLEGDGEEKNTRVKMHDVVRDVAIAIASDDENGFLVNIGRPLRALQETKKLNGRKRMSLMEIDNLVLPDHPLECPQLRSLLIKENASFSTEESCFEGMKSLVVLDVSISMLQLQRFSTLISSLQCVSNLRTLYLVDCDLSNQVSSLGGLRKLEILRLCNSDIGRLPEEIGNLSNLMCLDLTNAELSIVAPNVISKLSNLEELYMVCDYCDWDYEHNASLVEVTSLKRLSILRIRIRAETPHDMEFDWWNNLKEFHVIIVQQGFYFYKERPSLSLSYASSSTSSSLNISGVNLVEHWVSKLLSIPKLRRVTLKMCAGITNANLLFRSSETTPVNMMQLTGLSLIALPKLTSIWKGVVPIGSLQHLKEVRLFCCDSLEYLSSYSSAVALESVQSIFIQECNVMKKLIGSNRANEGGATSSYSYSSKFTILPPPPTFPNLHTLLIYYCRNLKSLFSFTMARNLQQLKELNVRRCPNLEEIIVKEEEEEEDVEHQYFLPRLHELVLERCENLRSIIQRNLPISFPLKEIEVIACSNLKQLPLQKEIASSLETLKGSTEWYEGLEWEDKSLQSVLKEKFKPPPTFHSNQESYKSEGEAMEAEDEESYESEEVAMEAEDEESYESEGEAMEVEDILPPIASSPKTSDGSSES